MRTQLQALEAKQLTQATQGNQGSLSWLLTFYQTRLHSYIRARLPADLQDTMDPDDLVQIVHMDAARQIHTFEPSDEPECFFHWLMTIARRRTIDAIRSARAAKRGNGMAKAPTAATGDESKVLLLEQLFTHTETPSGIMAGQEALTALDEAILDLPEDYQQVVRLYHLEQRPTDEIAEILGKSEAATYKIAQRSVQLLRGLMGRRSKFM